MFRAFAAFLGTQANSNNPNLFLLHPADLIAALEVAWDRRLEVANADLGRPFHRSDLNRFEDTWLGGFAFGAPPPTFPPPPPAGPRPLQPNIRPLLEALFPERLAKARGPIGILWDHLIYAYMIENTRIYEIFRRVVHEFVHGERLGTASAETQHWLRNTEELFFRDPPPFFVTAIAQLHPPRSGRRHAATRTSACSAWI